MNNAIKWIKLGLGSVAGFGASMIVSSVARNALDVDRLSPGKRVASILGASVLGMIAGDAADKYICNTVDDIWNGVQTIQKAMSSSDEEAENDG